MYMGAATIVDFDQLELRLRSGRTVVEIQASIAAREVAPTPPDPVKVMRSESKLPPELQAQALEIARREPAEVPRHAEFAPAQTMPLPTTVLPPPARVEIARDESSEILPVRLPAIERVAPVAQVDARAVVASTGSTTSDESPTLLANPSPPYPSDAYAARIEGTVKLDVWVDAEGRVREVKILESSGSISLDHAALRTVRDTWRFSIYRPRGVPTAYRREVPVRFQIGPR
jgi:protein TonB